MSRSNEWLRNAKADDSEVRKTRAMRNRGAGEVGQWVNGSGRSVESSVF